MGHYDATCQNKDCRKRLSWFGGINDRPACPHCGHVPEKIPVEVKNRKQRKPAVVTFTRSRIFCFLFAERQQVADFAGVQLEGECKESSGHTLPPTLLPGRLHSGSAEHDGRN